MLIEVALNGGRTRAEHSHVPCSPQELAAAAKEAVAAGAGAAHFHVRAADERESLDADDVARAVSAVRAAIPGVPFGVSTGLWMVRDARERQEKVAAWKTLPDFASVNFNEEGGIALAEMLLAKGMGVEAGMGSVLATEKFLESGLAGRCRWVLLEPEHQEMDAGARDCRENRNDVARRRDRFADHFARSRQHGLGADRCGSATRLRHPDRARRYPHFAGREGSERQCRIGCRSDEAGRSSCGGESRCM